MVGLVSKTTTGGDKRPTGLSRTWDLLARDCHSSLSLTANKYRTHTQAEQGWVGLRCFHVNVEWRKGWDTHKGVKRWPLVQEEVGGGETLDPTPWWGSVTHQTSRSSE